MPRRLWQDMGEMALQLAAVPQTDRSVGSDYATERPRPCQAGSFDGTHRDWRAKRNRPSRVVGR